MVLCRQNVEDVLTKIGHSWWIVLLIVYIYSLPPKSDFKKVLYLGMEGSLGGEI